jgi:hypothetical protein
MKDLSPLCQTDIKRAIKAALDAGLEVTGVKVNWIDGQIELATRLPLRGPMAGDDGSIGEGLYQGQDYAL